MQTGKAEKVLVVEGLRKSFGEVEALKGVSFEAEKGEILGVLGPNGAGKTTLIHALLGLITPDAGCVRIFDLDISVKRVEALERMNFASNYVSLPFSLTCLENLMVYARMYGVKNPRERCRECLDLFELTHLEKSVTRRLSSGQLMRLSLAKAMINEPAILLLDEPTSGLDPEIAQKTRKLLGRLSRERGTTVIYTSHNLHEMEEVSDRVLFLKAGEVHALGSPSELIERHKARSLEALFFSLIGSGEETDEA